MRTSLNEIAQAEAHLLKKSSQANALLFEARILLDRDLHQQVTSQRHVYDLVQQYSRKQLKQEIEAVHQQLFNQPEHLSFRQKIARIFLNR
jgi:DNA-binding transcriptional regulator YbjK